MIYLVLGRRYQGKSTLALHVAQHTPDTAQVLIDPRAQFALPDVPIVERATIEELSRPRVIVRLDRVETEFIALMRGYRAIVERAPRRRRALVLDEARFIDLDNPDLDWLCRCVDPRALTIIITAHRPVDIPVDLRAIADYWCLFQMTQEHDLKVIEERCGPVARSRVCRLPPRHYVVWDDGRATLGHCSKPESWYVPMLDDIIETPGLDVPVDDESENPWKLE